jgi:selenocysteine lyase/cysteine desulfurase
MTQWQQWRAEFPVCGRGVHLNHAGISPLSARVGRAIEAFAASAVMLAPGTSDEWDQRAEAVRRDAGLLLHAQPEEIAFVQNTAAGLSMIAAGLSWREGDNVVGVADEYPSNVYPWLGLRRWGVETRLVAHPNIRFGVDELRAAVDARTRVVTVSAVDWQSGFRSDLGALGQFCREQGVLFCVDGIQAVGALDIDVHTLGIDCLAAGGHKWLLAPEGCGVLFLSRDALERVHPVMLGWKSVKDPDTYLPYHFELREDAARFEPGSPPHLGIHALGAAIEMLLEIGPRAIENRILHLTESVAEELRRRGARVLSPWRASERSGIVTFQIGDAQRLQQTLTRAGIVTRVRMGGVRIAPHFYNNEEDLGRLLAVVDAIQ